MRYRSLLLVSLVAILLAGCNAGGPSNAEAKEVVYGLYLQDARIIEKRKCELTPEIEEEGYDNVWLIRYRFEESGNEGGMLIAEGDSEEYPWEIYAGMRETCPE